MGPSQDVFLKRYYAIVDLSLVEDGACGSVVLTYPGQEVWVNPANIDANGCLNLQAQYGAMWTQTIGLKQ